MEQKLLFNRAMSEYSITSLCDLLWTLDRSEATACLYNLIISLYPYYVGSTYRGIQSRHLVLAAY